MHCLPITVGIVKKHRIFPACQESTGFHKRPVDVGAYTFTATLEDNDVVRELVEMICQEPVAIAMDDYAGFEKVGPLGRNLTTSNSQTTSPPGKPPVSPLYGKAFSSVRDKVLYQIHFGADYTSGKYGWTTALDDVKKAVDWQLRQLNTGYIDYGFIHCLDEASDWDSYLENNVLGYLQALKAQGVMRHIGMSSHTPALAQAVLDTGLVDMLMFSINPGYDYHHGDYAKGSSDEREALYLRCEKGGVGISVMKAFSGGQLLDEKSSPFGKALTKSQCIQYAPDKPGVLTVLPGIRNKQDMEDILGFLKASDKEKDYSVLGSFTPADTEGKCVYCHHCQPCPVGLDIGLISKYYDLVKSGDTLAAGRYQKLEKKAADCVQCGHCDKRCPFHVDQSGRMKEISAYFSC